MAKYLNFILLFVIPAIIFAKTDKAFQMNSGINEYDIKEFFNNREQGNKINDVLNKKGRNNIFDFPQQYEAYLIHEASNSGSKNPCKQRMKEIEQQHENDKKRRLRNLSPKEKFNESHSHLINNRFNEVLQGFSTK